MARVIGTDGREPADPAGVLAARGVTLRRVAPPAWPSVRDDVLAAVDDPAALPAACDVPADLVAELLPTDPERAGVRGVLVVAGVDPTAPEAGVGFGVPHHNESSECHLVLGGRGVFGYPADDGEVFVGVEHGDVVAMRAGTVHRYLPLAEQAFVLRFDAPPGAGLVAHDLDTGPDAAPWPDPWA